MWDFGESVEGGERGVGSGQGRGGGAFYPYSLGRVMVEDMVVFPF